MNSSILTLFSQFIFLVPALIAYIVGLVLAIQRKKNHPFASLLAIWGFGILITESLIFTCMRSVFLIQLSSSGTTAMSVGWVFTLTSILQTILFVAGIGLIIAAIFSDRRRPTSPMMREELDDFDPPPPLRLPVASPPDSNETFRERRDS